jgi:hypothetical protein
MLRQALTSIANLVKRSSFLVVVIFAVIGGFALEGRAAGYYNAAFGFRKKEPFLKFANVALSPPAGACSALVSIQTMNGSGVATNVTSNLTVNLSGSGTTTFYSDSNCATPVTSVVIVTGSFSYPLYFSDTTVGSPVITATAGGYKTASQTHTVGTNPFVWTGGGANALWSNGLNWSGGAAPGTFDQAIFNSICSSNCSPTIAANIPGILGIRMTSGYSGTITKNNGVTMVLGQTGWFQEAGTFSAGNANLTLNGHFTLAGGTFTAGSAPVILNRDFTISGSGTFTAGTSTLSFFGTFGYYKQIRPNSTSFANVVFGSAGSCYGVSETMTGTMSAQNVTFSCGAPLIYNYSLIGGTVNVSGNLTVSAPVLGSVQISMVGSGTITGGGATFTVPNLTINSPGGTIDLVGTIVSFGNYTYTAGTVNAGTSTLIFSGENSYINQITPGASVTYNNVQIGSIGTCYGVNQQVIGTMYVQNLTISCSDSIHQSYLSAGSIEVAGNLTVNKVSVGAGIVKMVGSGTITGLTTGKVSNLVIDTAGTYGLSGTITVSGNYSYVNGTVNAGTSTLRFLAGDFIAAQAITPGSVDYNDIVLGSSVSCWGLTHTYTGTLKAQNLTVTCSGISPVTMNGGAITVAKDYAANALAVGTTTISMIGGNAATLSQSVSNGGPPGFSINKTSGIVVTLGSNVSLTHAGQTLNVASGNIDMATRSLTIASGLTLNGNTVTKNTGVLTVNGVVSGTGPLHGGTVDP